MHPRIALDGAGNPMVIWGRTSDESVHYAKWNGTTFTMPVQLNPAWMTIATASWMGPGIASKGDTVYVAAKRTPETSDTNRIFLFSSFDGGVTFNPPTELAFIGDSLSRFAAVTVDATGNPVVGFMKFNSVFLDSRWVVTRSNDYGLTFNTDVKASGWGNSSEVCDCCPGAILSSGDTTVMLYRDNNNNIRDTWAGVSVNNTTSFDFGFAADNLNWMVMNCPASGPDGIIVGDTLYSVFMNAASGLSRVYFSKTEISSGAVTNVSGVTTSISGLNQQNYPRIANHGLAAAIVWRQIVNGTVSLPIVYTDNIHNGFTSVFDTVDLNNAANIDIALYNNEIFVVWQDDLAGTVKFKRGVYTPASTGLTEIQNGISVYPNPVKSVLKLNGLKGARDNQVTIRNIAGQIIYSGVLTEKAEVDVSFLPAGLYVLTVNTESIVLNYRFVKEGGQ